MRINVIKDNHLIEVFAFENFTIKQLKQHIEHSEFHVPVHQQSLSFHDIELDNDERRISDYKIQDLACVKLHQTNNKMRINVSDGGKVHLLIDLEESFPTVFALKESVSRKSYHLPIHRIQLFFNDNELGGDDLFAHLSSYGVEHGSDVHMVCLQNEIMIRLMNSSGDHIYASFWATDTINKLKEFVADCKELAIPLENQRLFFDGSYLSHGTLSKNGVVDGSIIFVRQSSELITVNAKTIDGKILHLEIDPHFKVKDLKMMVNKSENIPPDKQFLLFNCKRLENERVLNECGITNNSRLDITIPFH